MMDEAFALRPATDTDVSALTRLLKEAFAEQAALSPPSGALTETDTKVRDAMETAGVFVAVVREGNGEADGETLVGCVFHAVERDALYLFRLAVRPTYRRRGIAAALLDACETTARDLGLRRTRLSVRLTLPRQQAYYERRGYRVVAFGTHPGFSRPTYATLEKSVGEHTSPPSPLS